MEPMQVNENAIFTPQRDYYDACIVGAGLSGVVIAQQYASQLAKNSIIIEKRSHIGGNVYDYVDKDTDILVNKYGAHLFHTNCPRVWDYIQQFSEWAVYEHRVRGFVDNKYVPIPVNIDTVNALFELSISNKTEMDAWLEQEQVHNDNPQNSEEMALSRVGQRLYDLIFEPYTLKQWAKTPRQLGPEVTARIPVRNNWDDRYFDDVFQALPKQGYTKMVQNMLDLPNIEVHINTDYFDIKSQLEGKCGHTYYSGPIDHYFGDQGYDKLEYRSINFERQVIKNIGTDKLHLQASVVNYPGAQYNFTRVVEYKHFLKQKSAHTVLFYERSTDEGDP
jgi:UDP-galactopyranose mutase